MIGFPLYCLALLCQKARLKYKHTLQKIIYRVSLYGKQGISFEKNAH